MNLTEAIRQLEAAFPDECLIITQKLCSDVIDGKRHRIITTNVCRIPEDFEAISAMGSLEEAVNELKGKK